MIKEIDIHCIDKGRYGFTVPYLYKIEKDSSREKSIRQILDYLSKQKKQYFIKYCGELEEFIIGLHKAKEDAPVYMYENFDNLFYDQDEISGIESFDDLVGFMVEKYQDKIDKQTFSKNYDTKLWE
ncbi:MAG: hypothetical protein N4A59_13350 [Marinifilum sp.]|jgi:hypothetical protein|nr:hypothetical protein [Marinifilum sp.]